MITQEDLRYHLNYSEETGLFTWVNPTSSRCNATFGAGSCTKDGYRRIGLGGKQYKAHRLVWLYVYGHMPENEIDHINGDKSDNRLCNLREATRKQNSENVRLMVTNASGHRGVHWDKATQKWMVRIGHFGSRHYLGVYANIEDAVTAVKNARDCCFTHHKTSYSA